MASSKVCLFPALCFLIIFTTFISSTESASCCMTYTRRPLNCKELRGYTIQSITGSCDINAVIFHLPSRYVCANPLKRWTQKVMRCLDNKRKMADKVLAGNLQKTTVADPQAKA